MQVELGFRGLGVGERERESDTPHAPGKKEKRDVQGFRGLGV